MNLVIGSDHRGFLLKQYLIENLQNDSLIEDVGCFNDNAVDYPDIASSLASKMKDKENTFGVIICGSGIGVSIAVNRFNFIRGALVHTVEDAKMARLHNDANVLCLASDKLSNEEALKIVQEFVKEKFENGRHKQRVEKLWKM